MLDGIFELAYFAEPPPLDIQILGSKMPVDISSLPSLVRLPIGGISLPLTLSSARYLPSSPTKLLASYPVYPDIGADFATNPYFLLSIDNPVPSLLLQCYQQFNYLLNET